MKLLGLVPKKTHTTPQRIEPKTFLANERTFLAWLHMGITIASIAAALLGFASGEGCACGIGLILLKVFRGSRVGCACVVDALGEAVCGGLMVF